MVAVGTVTARLQVFFWAIYVILEVHPSPPSPSFPPPLVSSLAPLPFFCLLQFFFQSFSVFVSVSNLYLLLMAFGCDLSTLSLV